MRVVTEDGEAFGVMDTRDAIAKAREMGLDLVEIAPTAKPPVCKIIDYGKLLYEQKKKAHEAKKKSRSRYRLRKLSSGPARTTTITVTEWSMPANGWARATRSGQP